MSVASPFVTCNLTVPPLQIKPEALPVDSITVVLLNAFALTLVFKFIAFAPAYLENILSRNMNKI
jgi:hypothetical protein